MESVGQMDPEIEIDIAEEDETWQPDEYGSCEEEACYYTDRYNSHDVNMDKHDSDVEHSQVQLKLDVKVEPVHTYLVLPVTFSEPCTRFYSIIQESCLGQNSHTRLGSNVWFSDFLEHGASTTPRMHLGCQPEPGTEWNLDELTETNTQPPNIRNISGDVKCPSLRKASVHDDDCKDDQAAQIDVSFQCSGSDSEVKGVASGKQHRCHECGATFTRSFNLKQHLVVHKGLKPHKCLECGAAFTQSGSLNRHLLIHKGVKPHKCVECGTGFTQLSHLKQHLLIHGGVKRCKCEDCGASFFHSNGLKKHQLIHKSVKVKDDMPV